MTRQLTVSGDELQLILNAPFPELEVTYPITGLLLFRAEQRREGVQIRSIAPASGFDEAADSDLWRRERPHPGDLLECFLASGAAQYLNLGEFRESQPAYRRTGRIYYAPDTNMLYHGFFSGTGLVKPAEVLISGTVREEIKASLNYKHTPHHVEELKRSSHYQKTLWDSLTNQRLKASRKASGLAMAEYDFVAPHAIVVDAVDALTSDTERNDEVFTRSVAVYSKRHGLYPVVLTCDAAMVDLCKLERLDFFLFQLPRSLEPGLISHACFLRLIRLLANMFGFVKVGRVLLQGEYAGKSRRDDVRVTFSNGDYEWVEKHLEASRSLRKLLR